MRMLRQVIFMAALLTAAPAAAQTPVTEAAIRAFIAGQEAAWNRGDLDGYFAGFTLGATFTDQAYVGDKPPVPYGTSTLTEARRLTARALAKARSRESAQVTRVEIATDGASARVFARVQTQVDSPSGQRRLCASRVQTLINAGGKLRSRGRTDTFYKCPR